MRPIGKLFDPRQAQAFCDYLFIRDIAAEGDEDDGTIWIEDEDQLEEAVRLMAVFKSEVGEDDYLQLHTEAETKRDEVFADAEADAKRIFNRDDVLKKIGGSGFLGRLRPGPATIALAVLSGVVTILSGFGKAQWCESWMFIAEIMDGGRYLKAFLADVLRGQVWRLVSPIFIHLDPIHLLFNMWWLLDLGGMIERRRGVVHFLLLVLATAVGSNILQFGLSHPLFGGMSGVVFGLLGYVWVAGRIAPDTGFFLHQTIVYLMLGWLVLGFVLPMMHMANWAHLGGLLIGAGFAYVEFAVLRRRS